MQLSIFSDGEVEDRYRIAYGDLLFAWSGTPGTSFGAHLWRGPDAVLNQHIFKLEFDRSSVDPEYLCYAINETLHEQEAKSHGGVGLRHVTKDAFSQTRIPLPSYAEQKQIANVLLGMRSKVSTIDKVLDQTHQDAGRARIAVLQAAFDGELTRVWRARNRDTESVGELLARVPKPEQGRGGREPTSRLIAGRSAISVNSPDIPLPEGWRWVSLLRLAKQETGHTPSRRKPEYWDGNIPWLGIKDASANHGGYIQDTSQKITSAGLANSSARLLPSGTVCLSRTASVGYVVILGSEMATSQDFATWTCTEALMPEYLLYALMSEGSSIRRFGEGSVHTTIYFPEIRAFHIRLPPLQEQAEIVKQIQHIFAQLENLSKLARDVASYASKLDRQIVARCFEGAFTSVPPGEENAHDLMSRLRRPPDRPATTPVKIQRRELLVKSLEEVLRDAGDWLTAQEAFRRCGVASGAAVEEVELIFAQLRNLDQANLLEVQPIFDAEGRKTEDRIKLSRLVCV